MDGFDGARVGHLGPWAGDKALYLMKDKRSRSGLVKVLANAEFCRPRVRHERDLKKGRHT